MYAFALLATLAALAAAQEDPTQSIVIRLPAQAVKPKFLEAIAPPRAVQPPVEQQQHQAQPQQPAPQPAQAHQVPQFVPQPAVVAQTPAPQPQQSFVPQSAAPAARQPQFPGAAPPGTSGSQQAFVPRDQATVPPPPPVTLPPDVQNQLIKFFGLDSFGIPGLTGHHPNGFAGAIQEMRAAGIPVPGVPVEHITGNKDGQNAVQSDVLAQANPNFANQLSQLEQEARNPGPYKGQSAIPLPADKPGDNGLIGLLSTTVRKIVKDTGLSDALQQSLPYAIGTGTDGEVATASGAAAGAAAAGVKNTGDTEAISTSKDSAVETIATRPRGDVRRQPSALQRAVSSFAGVLGGGGGNSPTHAGLPRIPGIPLLPGGIPRNSQGQIDVVSLIGAITKRVSNGTTLSDVLPPEQLQTLADNVTDALLPDTPANIDLGKFMGRWFEGINSPRATDQRCVVHHYGGLTNNEKTATFTALKIYREGSEYGHVRYSIGYAFRGGNKDAMLQLHSSESSDAQPFWIYKLGPVGKDRLDNPQYEYAIVSNWVKYPITVLVRDPDTFKRKYQKEVLRWLEDQGFLNAFIRAFNLLQPANYANCQYADNTFEVFGK